MSCMACGEGFMPSQNEVVSPTNQLTRERHSRLYFFALPLLNHTL